MESGYEMDRLPVDNLIQGQQSLVQKNKGVSF